MHAALADAVLVLHTAIVLFVVGGLVLVVLGNALGWRWINRWWFRLLHLGAIAVVVAESWLGLVCPLTALEAWLRTQAGAAVHGQGFIEHWLQRLLFYSAPPWVFMLAYSVFFALVGGRLVALATAALAALGLPPPPRTRHNAAPRARPSGGRTGSSCHTRCSGRSGPAPRRARAWPTASSSRASRSDSAKSTSRSPSR